MPFLSKRGTLRRREQTYKSHEAARRAFYKWVAKERLYYPLRWCDYFEDWERMRVRGFTSYSYSTTGWGRLGYPVFRDWKSNAYTDWDNAFQVHRELWKDEEIALTQRRFEEDMERIRQEIRAENESWQAAERKRLHSNPRTIKTFQALAGFATLQK